MDTNRRRFLKLGGTAVASLTGAVACRSTPAPSTQESQAPDEPLLVAGAETFRFGITFIGLCSFIDTRAAGGSVVNVGLVNYLAGNNTLGLPPHRPVLGVPHDAVAASDKKPDFDDPVNKIDFWSLEGYKVTLSGLNPSSLIVNRGPLSKDMNNCIDLVDDPQFTRWNNMNWVPSFKELVDDNTLKPDAELYALTQYSPLLSWVTIESGRFEDAGIQNYSENEVFSRYVLQFDPVRPGGMHSDPMSMKERVRYRTRAISGQASINLTNPANGATVNAIKLKKIGNNRVDCIIRNSPNQVHELAPGERFTHFAGYYQLLKNVPQVQPVPKVIKTDCRMNDGSTACTDTQWP